MLESASFFFVEHLKLLVGSYDLAGRIISQEDEGGNRQEDEKAALAYNDFMLLY